MREVASSSGGDGCESSVGAFKESDEPSGQVYGRRFDANSGDSLALIAQRVRPGSKVLDIGSGPGVLGAHLATERDCLVDGVERSAAAAHLARPYYRRLAVGDLEHTALECFGLDGAYDFIICADVLEHLREPQLLLGQLGELLNSQGRLIVSIPNAGYAGLVADLIAGDFDYRDEGLLDRTHLRFFTLRSIFAMLGRAGFGVSAVDRVILPVEDSEFSKRRIDCFAPALQHWLLHRADALVYQFVIVARFGLPDEVDFSAPAMRPPEYRFRSQLFWRNADSEFSEESSRVELGCMGQERQRLRFEIPPNAKADVLRFDPADRAGFIRLYSMTLVGMRGERLWDWKVGSALPAIAWNQLRPLTRLESEPDALGLHSDGEDPSMCFHLPPAAARALEAGGALEVEISWPMSTDGYALARDYVPRVEFEALKTKLDALQQLEPIDRVGASAGSTKRFSRAWWKHWYRGSSER